MKDCISNFLVYCNTHYKSITLILSVEMSLILHGLPSQVGNGLSHCPSLPHISIELPFRYVLGPWQLNVRNRSGRMGSLLSGKPFTITCPSAGGKSQLKAEETRQSFHVKTYCLYLFIYLLIRQFSQPILMLSLSEINVLSWPLMSNQYAHGSLWCQEKTHKFLMYL